VEASGQRTGLHWLTIPATSVDFVQYILVSLAALSYWIGSLRVCHLEWSGCIAVMVGWGCWRIMLCTAVWLSRGRQLHGGSWAEVGLNPRNLWVRSEAVMVRHGPRVMLTRRSSDVAGSVKQCPPRVVTCSCYQCGAFYCDVYAWEDLHEDC
jgi:hypothetical protein